jgi:hypothetical protein
MQNQDPINQITHTLHEYEEPYHLGAWDRFTRHRELKRRKTFYQWIAAASAVLLLVSSAWLIDRTPDSDGLTTQSIPPPPELPLPGTAPETPDATDPVPTPPSIPSDPIAAADTDQVGHEMDEPAQAQAGYTPDWSDSEMLTFNTFGTLPAPAGLSRLNTVQVESGLDAPHLAMPVRARQARDEAAERVVAADDLRRGDRRSGFTFGLAYASLINVNPNSTDWNTGGGLSVKWNVSDRVALASGLILAQSRLSYRDTPVDNPMVSQDEITSSEMEIDFLSLEIPLNLQYSVSDRFYLSGGISSASFLRENYTYQYEFQQVVTNTVMVNGEYKPVTQLVTFSQSEQESEPSFSSFHLLSFYNLSAGYNLTRKENSSVGVTIEPFVKLPAGSFAAGNVSYTTGGIQLKVNF